MSGSSLLSSCEITINSVIKRLTKLEGKNKYALESEFREWINAIESDDKRYDVLYINEMK